MKHPSQVTNTGLEPPGGRRSRRVFLRDLGLFAAAAALVQSPTFLLDRGWTAVAEAAAPDLVHDTFNGLVAFVVPGPDAYSVAQGVSTFEPGGIDANIIEVLIGTMDASVPFLPQFAVTIAGILNGIAQQVNPNADGTFPSPFARLSFQEKVQVFAVMDGHDPVKPIAGILPAIVAFLAYSEAGVFDPATRSLTAQPVGWMLSEYGGVADGHDEFKGYFQNRRKAL